MPIRWARAGRARRADPANLCQTLVSPRQPGRFDDRCCEGGRCCEGRRCCAGGRRRLAEHFPIVEHGHLRGEIFQVPEMPKASRREALVLDVLARSKVLINVCLFGAPLGIHVPQRSCCKGRRTAAHWRYCYTLLQEITSDLHTLLQFSWRRVIACRAVTPVRLDGRSQQAPLAS